MYGFTDPELDFQHIINKPTDPHSISGNKINAVFFDQKKNAWVATNMGIIKLTKTKNLFMPFLTNNDTEKRIRGNEIKHIEIDKDNGLWLSHEKGLDHINSSGDVVAN